MSSEHQYREELEQIRAHGVFALHPNDWTTPLHMAAFGYAPNAREAKELVAAMDDPEKIGGGHQLLTVGEFCEFHREWKKTKRNAK